MMHYRLSRYLRNPQVSKSQYCKDDPLKRKELHATLREKCTQGKVQSLVVRPWNGLLTCPTHSLENGQTCSPLYHTSNSNQPFSTWTFKSNYQYFQPLLKIILASQSLSLNFRLDHSGACTPHNYPGDFPDKELLKCFQVNKPQKKI